MNDVQTNHIGNHQHARPETTTAVTPTIGRVCQLATKNKGRKPSAKRQTEIRTNSHAANGILKCTFLPKLKTAPSVQACQKTERDFYKSLSKFAKHYCIETMQTKDFDFPYNITLAMWDMETKVKRTHINWDSFKLVQNGKKTFFMSEERCYVDTTLYYIPVAPLFKMLNNPKRKKTAQLLISVCSYLYQIVAIPYFRQEDSYLYWMYEMQKEWVEQDDETDETEGYRREFLKAELIGDNIEQKLFNRSNLQFFEKRLSRFKSLDTFDKECWQVAHYAFALYTEYPTANIFRNASLHEQDLDMDDYENETIGMEKYISFIADTKGWLYESLKDSINSEFNECSAMQEPTLCKSFDGSQITTNNLDFENRLFSLLDELCALLYDYKTTEK